MSAVSWSEWTTLEGRRVASAHDREDEMVEQRDEPQPVARAPRDIMNLELFEIVLSSQHPPYAGIVFANRVEEKEDAQDH